MELLIILTRIHAFPLRGLATSHDYILFANQLSQNWQKRLSALRIAQFPWDPAPITSNVQSYTNVKNTAPNDPLESAAAGAKGSGGYNGVRIKTEENENNAPGLMNGFPTSNMDTQVAQQRAVSFMERDFGSQATASIGALQQQTGLSLPGQSRPNGLQLPGQTQQPQQIKQQSPIQQQNNQAQQTQQPPSATKSQFSSNTVGNEQTDGSGDVPDRWLNLRSLSLSNNNEHRLAADETLRQKVEQMSDIMDSGLMVPLDEQRCRKGKKLKARQRLRAQSATMMAQQKTSPSSSSSSTSSHDEAHQIPQYDGVLEDEKPIKTEEDGDEDDEDAINSALDDTDDEIDKEQDDGEDLGETMLCLYDKVQRVKNKWKCTLKDGILTTNQKEYVIFFFPWQIEALNSYKANPNPCRYLFQKAQGEFEW